MRKCRPMTTNYICLDDEDEKVGPIVELIEKSSSSIKISVRTPAKFDEEIRLLSAESLDGLLLDLRLDRSPNQDGIRVNYRALALAQELRTRMTEGEILSFPIVLWSVDQNFKVSYDRDETGHDLFDAQYFKGAINDEGRDVAGEMIALAEGYKTIRTYRSRTVKNIYSRLVDLVEDYDVLDPRIAADIGQDRKFPAHIFARSIFRNLILASGPLVGEELLAARLGVDIESSPDWNKLLNKFASGAVYTGVFGTAWHRWWMFRIQERWAEISPSAPLQSLTAEERVEILRKSQRLKELVPAKPLEQGYSTNFWHVCKLLRAPISSRDAVQLFADRREWQDAVYCSIKAVLDRKHISEGYVLHAFERERIRALIDSLKNGQK